MLLGMYFQVAPVVLLTIGAVLQCMTAYVLSKNSLCITALISVVITAVSAYLILPVLLNKAPDFPVSPGEVRAFGEWAVGITAMMALVISTFFGITSVRSAGGGSAQHKTN